MDLSWFCFHFTGQGQPRQVSGGAPQAPPPGVPPQGPEVPRPLPRGRIPQEEEGGISIVSIESDHVLLISHHRLGTNEESLMMVRSDRRPREKKESVATHACNTPIVIHVPWGVRGV